MVSINEIFEYLTDFAPLDMKMDFDNPGFLVGYGNKGVSRVVISLDITDDVIEEAIEKEAQLIVSHHPLFFSLKSVTDGDRIGRKILKLAENGISAICMHTNLDAAQGGVNDALAEAAGLTNTEILNVEGIRSNGEKYSYGRYGELRTPLTMAEYLKMLKKSLNANGLRYHDAGKKVKKVAVVGGSGGGMLDFAIEAGCDTFITADIKYDSFLTAKELKINLIDADHFCSENTVIPYLARRIRLGFPGLEVILSDRHCQTARFI